MNIKLIKNRSDIGAGTRGSDLGIDAIEIAAINKGSNYFNQFPYVDVETRNEAVYGIPQSKYAKRIDEVLKQSEHVSKVVSETLKEDYFPLVFSGDHSSAMGTVGGINSAFPSAILGIIWIDAHADIHSPYSTPSGNLHGMPLAAAHGLDNLEVGKNNIDSRTAEVWGQLKKLASGLEKKNETSNLLYFGVRDTEPEEDQIIQKFNVRNFSVNELRGKGIARCVKEGLERLAMCDLIYVSFDVDVLDCELISDGTGTPVEKGLNKQEVIMILSQLIASQKVVCLEVVEVNPLLDSKGNSMAETAFDIIQNTTNDILCIKGEFKRKHVGDQ
jgi:arginase